MESEDERMDVLDTIRARKSVRSYEPTPVPDDVLDKLLEAVRLSPSASNYQPWHFVIVTDPEKRRELSAGRYAKFLKDTPCVVVGLGDRESSAEWFTVDVTIALQNLVLAATALGLGTCWIGSFTEGEVKTVLNIPDKYAVVAMIALGYERARPSIGGKIIAHVHRRKTLDQIVSYESFGRTKGG